MAEALTVVKQVQELLESDDIVADLADETTAADLRAGLAELTEPDFEIAMLAADYAPGGMELSGPDGFRQAWLEWTSAFESFRIEIEDTIEAPQHIVTLVRQIGRTKTGGVEIEAPAAAVWTVRDGKVARVEFHLDQERALRAAGLEPE